MSRPTYSCFISYSHQDEVFSQKLNKRLREAGVAVWIDEDNMRSGCKIHQQIEKAIFSHDKLLLVLSESSMESEWVITEIRKARRLELRDNRRMLFPIRLVGMSRIKDWESFDADTGKDLAVEVREYFISDFSDWANEGAFEKAVLRLLADLKAEQG